jgi:predicted  nucleic acid-binding Zn-ribbon protein
MHQDLKKLIRLQSVDAAVLDYQARTDAFPSRSKALDEQLRAAKEEVERASAAIENNKARRKEFETRVTDLEAKISKYRDQLMSVKTNEEYRAMTKEIEYSQAGISREEDQILLLLEETETLTKALEDATAKLTSDEQTVQAERSRLEALNEEDTRTLKAYLEERAELARDVDEDVLAHYERVRRARGGVAVAAARDEECEICHVRMRPQVFQEVRRNDAIISCDSCNRILYDPENLDHPFEVV